jgi:membrane protein
MVTRFLLSVTPWLAVSLMLASIYRFLPHPHVPFKHALTGGVIAGLGFELMRWLFSFYLHHFRGYAAVYGAFAAFPIFLMWIYLCWSIVLAGAVLTASFSYWRGDAWRIPRDHPDQQFRDALRILLFLMRRRDEAVTMTTLQHTLEMGYDSLETAILPMAEAGLLTEDRFRDCRANDPAWTATVGDVWSLFHRGPLLRSHSPGDASLEHVIQRLDAITETTLAIPLTTLITEQ